MYVFNIYTLKKNHVTRYLTMEIQPHLTMDILVNKFCYNIMGCYHDLSIPHTKETI